MIRNTCHGPPANLPRSSGTLQHTDTPPLHAPPGSERALRDVGQVGMGGVGLRRWSQGLSEGEEGSQGRARLRTVYNRSGGLFICTALPETAVTSSATSFQLLLSYQFPASPLFVPPLAS